MQFELTAELIDEILFFMEDQNGMVYLDTHKGIVFNPESDISDDDEPGKNNFDGNGRYIDLPEWGPSDGFRLMERFTASLRNPVVQKELSAALDRGKGVFRAFKDTLSRYPEVENLWFKYKERGMKREITRWYNALRESWGLAQIGEEPEDIDGLAQEDFRFREGAAADREAAEKLHRECLADSAPADELSHWVFPGTLSIVAENSGGEFSAYISAVYRPPAGIHICALEVKPEYRGLGIGETLLARILEQADRGNIPCISIDLPAGIENFSRVLVRESFCAGVTRYYRQK